MLQIIVPAAELYDELNEEFIYKKEQTLKLEHSLVSLQKWESKWHKPFLTKEVKTDEETIDYVKCMTLTENVDPEVYTRLSKENVAQINKYIDDPMTATTFREENAKKGSREIVTAEIIYYWMFSLNIPFECREWHLNQLLAQIRTCNIKNTPPKKLSKGEIMRRNAALNEARRKQLNTKG